MAALPAGLVVASTCSVRRRCNCLIESCKRHHFIYTDTMQSWQLDGSFDVQHFLADNRYVAQIVASWSGLCVDNEKSPSFEARKCYTHPMRKLYVQQQAENEFNRIQL